MSTLPTEPQPLLRVRDLVKRFPIKGGLLGREVEAVHAVSGVSFDLRPARRSASSASRAAARAPPAAASCA
jgi:ABC-type glutathione transport system ATPase component